MSLSINLDIAKRLDITCRKGDTFSLELFIKDADGVPLNLTTPDKYTFKMEVRPSDSSSDVVIDTSSSGFTIVGTDNGVVTISASSTVMSEAPSGLYVYDLEATETFSDNVQTWFFGIFKINEDVTV
jgi:hypothetical protein